MINFAPFLYRDIVSDSCGPIGKVELTETQILNTCGGYEALAYLHQSLSLTKFDVFYLYSNADGSGSASTKNEAIYKAISEALERWAFYVTFSSSDKERYGFLIDPSTTGMAAFPGLFKFQARSLAYREALERYALVAWWAGLLPLRKLNYREGIVAYEIVTADSSPSVALLTRKVGERFVYGFAAHKNFKKACLKAEIELERNAYVLTLPFEIPKEKEISTLEKRLLYFSESEGRKLFEQRVFTSLKLEAFPPLPKLCVDSEIKGPWTKYTTVWRCLFTYPVDVKTEQVDFFLF